MFKSLLKSLWKNGGKVFNNLKNVVEYTKVFHIVDKFSMVFSTAYSRDFNLLFGGFYTFSTQLTITTKII